MKSEIVPTLVLARTGSVPEFQKLPQGLRISIIASNVISYNTGTKSYES